MTGGQSVKLCHNFIIIATYLGIRLTLGVYAKSVRDL